VIEYDISLLSGDLVFELQTSNLGVNLLDTDHITDPIVLRCWTFQIVSNDKYKSVEHRAVVNRDRPRMSVATFYDPSKSRYISPASALLENNHPALFRSVLFGEHVSAWYYTGPDGKKNIESLVIEG
jgi:isopenicillin N synthase-like dioxygenase